MPQFYVCFQRSPGDLRRTYLVTVTTPTMPNPICDKADVIQKIEMLKPAFENLKRYSGDGYGDALETLDNCIIGCLSDILGIPKEHFKYRPPNSNFTAPPTSGNEFEPIVVFQTAA